MTCCLRNSCSASELRWPVVRRLSEQVTAAAFDRLRRRLESAHFYSNADNAPRNAFEATGMIIASHLGHFWTGSVGKRIGATVLRVTPACRSLIPSLLDSPDVGLQQNGTVSVIERSG